MADERQVDRPVEKLVEEEQIDAKTDGPQEHADHEVVDEEPAIAVGNSREGDEEYDDEEEERPASKKKPGLLARFVAKTGLDPPTLIMMFKSVNAYQA
jgi:hypothetical protein